MLDNPLSETNLRLCELTEDQQYRRHGARDPNRSSGHIGTGEGPDCQGERQTLKRMNDEARTGMRPKRNEWRAKEKREGTLTLRGEKHFYDKKKAVSR